MCGSQYDISLPLDVMYNIVEDVRERCAHLALGTIAYGHIGDSTLDTAVVKIYLLVSLSVKGNLHLNVTGKTHSSELRDCLEPFIFDWTGQDHIS